MNSTGKDRAGFDPDVAKWGVWAVLRAFRTAVVKWSFVLLFGATSLIAAPPANFSVEDVLTGINQPITLKFLPDGRFLLLQKQGKISIVDVSGVVTQSETYMDLSSSAHADGLNFDQERGVLDIAIDPNFLAEPYIYVFYTPATGPNGARSRVSRFTHMQIAGGTSSRGNLGSELILWEDTQGYDSCCHFGGGIDFGPDGNIWLSTGDHFQGSYASSLEHAGGKIHRFTPTGEIPADNPLVDGAGPMVDSIFAYGLRNPFRSRWDLASGRYFIAEVGGNTQSIAWEDLHVIDYDYGSARFIDGDFGTAQDNLVYDAINFGWPTVEGLPPYDDFPGWTITNVVGDPLFGYPHDGNTTAITGGVVYHGDMFPPEFEGAYFYADSTRDFIRYIKFNPDGSVAPNPNPDPIDIQNPDSTSYPFDLEPLGRITSFDIGPDGALYYVSFTDSGGAYGEPNPAILGGVRRYIYDDGNARPVVVTYSPDVTSGPSPLDVNFTVEATDADGDAMSYFIEFGDGNFSPYLPLPAGTPVVVSHIYADDGLYTPILRVSDATRTTQVETTVSVGTAPVITSLTATNSRTGPNSSTFRFGDTITFQAEATDAEDGMLTGANFSWSVSFIRPGNVHPSLGPVDGTESVDFPIPDQGQGFSGPVYYRCFLTVTDSSGLVTTSSYDIFPEKSNISFDTVPAGITVQVNGNTAEPAPYVLDTLINYDHVITVPDTVCISGVEYGFVDWSNGVSTAQQVYNVPVEDSALTANYIAIGACGQVPEDGLVMHLRAGAGVVVDGSGVVAWEDQTDSPNVLTAIGSPTYVDGAGWSEGYVHFDGVDDAVMQSGFWGLPVGNADRTVLMVVRYNGLNAAGSGWVGFSYGNPTTNHAFGLTLTPTGNLGVQAWGSNDAAAYPEVDGVGQWLAHAAVFQSGVLTQYLNGAEIGTANRTYGTGSGEIRIAEELGGGKNLDMDVAEVLVYDRALDASELELAQSYFEAFHEIGSGGPTNSDPVVAITAPADGSSIGSNSLPLNLSGSATDAEDGDLGSSIMWTSSIDGALGSGATIAANLSVGSHTITATVTDSASAVGSATIALTVTDEGGTNGRPVVTILSPANGATFSDSGVAINFWASAADAEDGDLSAAISWTSDIDGPLGTGETIQTALSSGTHTITASVADSSAATSTDTVTITVWAGGLPPLTTSGLVVHLESDLNVSLQSGSSVAAWLDQSGMGNDLEAGGDPQLISDGSPSGLPVIRFDGVSDKLERINFQAPLGGLPTGNANRTMFVVASYTSSTWWSGVAYGTGSNNKAFGLAVTYPGGDLVLQGWGGGNDLVSTTPGIGAGWLVHSAVLENGVATMFKDGASIAQFSHTFQTGLTRLTIGKEISDLGYVGMDLAAVLIYNRALSAAERASVEDYLQAKYLQADPGQQLSVPTVTISAPGDGSTFVEGEKIAFAATASDLEDGNLSGSISWSSDVDGPLGTGAGVTVSNLSVGTHVISAAATDSNGQTGMAQVSVEVESNNTMPVIAITAPADGTEINVGTGLNLDATASDAEDGDLSSVVEWSSNVDGLLGTGGSLVVDTLTPGNHTLTASVIDSGNATASATVAVKVIGGSAPPLSSDLVLQLESDQGVSVNGGSVTGWVDQSDSGNHLSGFGGVQYVDGAAPSGQSVLRLDGVDDYLERVNATAPLGGLPTGNANRTMFVVASYTSSTWWSGVAYGKGGHNQAFGLGVTHPAGDLVLQGWGGGNDLVSTTPGIGAGWLVHSAVLENGVATMFKDGASIAQFSHTFQTGLTRLRVGKEISDFGYVGMDVAAVLIYDRALSAAERASVEDYLQAKYLQAPVGN